MHVKSRSPANTRGVYWSPYTPVSCSRKRLKDCSCRRSLKASRSLVCNAGGLWGLFKSPAPKVQADIDPLSGIDWAVGTDQQEDLLCEFIEEWNGGEVKQQVLLRIGSSADVGEFEQLCDKVGWPPREQDKVQVALANSYLILSVVLRSSTAAAGQVDERLIGLARATSDHAFNATIWDVIVDPDYQGRGIGRGLVKKMTRILLQREISNVTLFATAESVSFYEQLGFEADPDGIKGMFWYPQ